MATIYQKVPTDKGMILAPREGYFRKFNFSTWTEVRVGMYFGMVTAVGDNAQGVVETVNLNTNADEICFGIKNSDNNILPGFAGSTFWGTLHEGVDISSILVANPYIGTNTNGRSSIGTANGTAIAGRTYPTYSLGAVMNYPANVTGASGYCGFFALKFKIQNLGLAGQQVLITGASAGTVAGTDYSPAALRIQMNNAAYSINTTYLPWVNGSIPLPIPDAYFIRVPFFNNRIRISCIRAIRYA